PRRGGAGGQVRRRRSTLIYCDLDGARVALAGEGGEGVSPAVEGEGVGEHGRDVHPSLLNQVEVVGDAVLAFAVDLLEPEGVGPDEAHLFEVQRGPLEAAGRPDTGDDHRPPSLKDPYPDLERLRLADGVVDDVDPPRVAPGQTLPRRPQHTARPAGQAFDEVEARVGVEDAGAQLAGHGGLARPAGEGGDLHSG